jgi:hypothetical protein
MVSVAPTKRWNVRRLLSPTTAEKLPSAGNARFVTFPAHMIRD